MSHSKGFTIKNDKQIISVAGDIELGMDGIALGVRGQGGASKELILQYGNGLVLTSANGKKWKIFVTDLGALFTEEIVG